MKIKNITFPNNERVVIEVEEYPERSWDFLWKDFTSIADFKKTMKNVEKEKKLKETNKKELIKLIGTVI